MLSKLTFTSDGRTNISLEAASRLIIVDVLIVRMLRSKSLPHVDLKEFISDAKQHFCSVINEIN